MHGDADGENPFYPFDPNPVAEMHQVAGVTRELPLEFPLPAEVLVVRVFHPFFHHPLIAEVVHLLQDQQSDHEPERHARLARVAVKGGELLLEGIPGNLICQQKQRVHGVELLQQTRRHETRLILIWGFANHMPIRLTGFLQHFRQNWSKLARFLLLIPLLIQVSRCS